ncbi:hypothetical protein BH23BAC3_BH23BAC3_30810 [soil metagenome]
MIVLSSMPCKLNAQPTIAAEWNEQILEAIRNDYARPNVHARNLFHLSAAMYDAWSIYDDVAEPYLVGKTVGEFTSEFNGIPLPADIEKARAEAISYTAYRLIHHRFHESPGANGVIQRIDSLMAANGFDTSITATNYTQGSPIALGNFVAETYIQFGLTDGSKEHLGYENEFYLPVNEPLIIINPGNPSLTQPNRWQPIAFDIFIDQAGNVIPDNTPEFIGAEWGNVLPFALKSKDKTVYLRDGHSYSVYHDPGPPPLLDNEDSEATEQFLWSFTRIPVWASYHDPEDGVKIDISPASIGNIEKLPDSFDQHRDFYSFIEDGIDSFGHQINPSTGIPYEAQMVFRGDYTRVISEYWADGPSSETPPGHWFTLINSISNHPQISRQFKGTGLELSPLEWDVKFYFALGAAMHDAAIAAWGIKGWYDFVRPISILRWMSDNGQRSDSTKPSYHPDGMPLIENFIELVTEADPLAGDQGEHIGKIKFYTWRGHSYINDPEIETAGVGWMLAENWWPYQQPTFVTPPFAGYVSGHSTYSYAAAVVLENFTGDPFFPGGMGQFIAKKNDYLEFETGPSEDVVLQWATYRDAAAQSSLSRILGGIHPTIDDIPGRKIGIKTGEQSFSLAENYFTGEVTPDSSHLNPNPEAWALHQNYPNPFNPSTTILYELSLPAQVKLMIYDITGRLVSTEIGESKTAGIHQFTWNADGLASGVYLYRLIAATPDGQTIFSETKKMTLVR